MSDYENGLNAILQEVSHVSKAQAHPGSFRCYILSRHVSHYHCSGYYRPYGLQKLADGIRDLHHCDPLLFVRLHFSLPAFKKIAALLNHFPNPH